MQTGMDHPVLETLLKKVHAWAAIVAPQLDVIARVASMSDHQSVHFFFSVVRTKIAHSVVFASCDLDANVVVAVV